MPTALPSPENDFLDSFESAVYHAPVRLQHTWRDYVQIVIERIWVLVTVLLIALVGGAVWQSRQRPMYRTTARVEIAIRQPKPIEADNVVQAANIWDQAYVQNQLRTLQSRSVARQAAIILQRQDPARFPEGEERRAGIVREVSSATQATLVKESRMVDITATSLDGERAALIANAVAEAFLQQNLDQRMEASLGSLKWLSDQAAQYKLALDQSELALQVYRETELANSLVDQQNLVATRLLDIGTALTKAETERLSIETEWQSIQAAQAVEGDLSKLHFIAQHPTVLQALAAILDKEAEIGAQSRRYKAMHPTMRTLNAEMDELIAKRNRACLDVANGVRAQLDMAITQETRLRTALEEQQEVAFELDRKLLKYADLQREADADRQLYDSVLTRMKETSVAGKMTVNDMRILDSAPVSTHPYNINFKRTITMAATGGLGAGLALCFLLHVLDDRIKRTDDIEHSLGISVMGVIPTVRADDASARARVTHLNPQSTEAEAFRNLRAAIQLQNPDGGLHVVMVTSASPSAGKSLVASNLSIVLAQNGMRTLLIDADLRRPTAHRTFGLTNKRGLTDVLKGGPHWEKALCDSGIPNLSVLPAGRPPPNPAELLDSKTMTALLASARERFDRVIVDSPPVFGISDPLILQPKVDATLFVVRFDYSRRRALNHAMTKLNTPHAGFIGAIMNNVPVHRRRGYYYYGRYYGYDKRYYRYGDAYHYGADETTGKKV